MVWEKKFHTCQTIKKKRTGTSSQQRMKQRKLKMAATSESCCKLRNGVGEDIPHLSNIEQKNSFSEQPMKQRVNVEHSLDHWGLSKQAPNMLAQERLHWTLTAYLTNSRWIGVRVRCS